MMQRCKGGILLTYDLEGSVCDLTEIVSLNLTSATVGGGGGGLSGCPVSRDRCDSGTFRIQVRSIATLTSWVSFTVVKIEFSRIIK